MSSQRPRTTTRSSAFTARTLLTALAVVGAVCSPQIARAAGTELEPVPFDGKSVKLDGRLKDWPGGFVQLAETLQGKSDGKDPAVEAAVGYDDTHLWVAFDVSDKSYVCTEAFGPNEDHGEFLLAFPKLTGGTKTYALSIYGGQAGRFAGVVKLDGAPVADAKGVVGPGSGGPGYTIEAKIPWAAFPEAAKLRVGLRGEVRFKDQDADGSSALLGTTRGGLPDFPLDAEQALVTTLLKNQLPHRVTTQKFGDVADDGALERVAAHGRALSITGHAYRKGKQFFLVDAGGTVNRLELHDFDGDGKQEIALLRLGHEDSDAPREYLEIYKLDGEDPKRIFAHEVAVSPRAGEIRNAVSFEKRGAKTVVVLKAVAAKGLTADSFKEPTATDVPGVLLPWAGIASRTFGWDGSAFSKLEEKAGAAGKAKVEPKLVVEGAKPPPAPRPPTADELQDQVYALYKKERKLGAQKPRFDFVTDVAEDERPERVVVHGRDIVVFGKGFKGGAGFVFTSVMVADERDLHAVTTRDLTGDGKAEIILFGSTYAKSTLGSQLVKRDLMLVFTIEGGNIERILTAEIGRGIGSDRILAGIGFTAAKDKGVVIELSKGRTVGWNKKTYPFTADETAQNGVEPLVLPWSDSKRRYHFDGKAFVLE